MRKLQRGFTLVEIVVVVIILGLLAAIVIPQFTNATGDARGNSVASTLYALRTQIEVYKLHHADNLPPTGSFWSQLLYASNTTGTTNTTVNTTYPFGPYIQAIPVNPANGQSAVAAAAATNVGWVFTVSGNQYTLQAVDSTGSGVLLY